MGLFGRDDRPQNPAAQAKPKPEPKAQPNRSNAGPASGAASTTIAQTCAIKGDLNSSGDVCIEGEFSGSVDTSAHLQVAQSGRVDAKLHGKNVSIAGQVKGNVTAVERIELEPSANVHGNIIAPRILIKDGATFEGQVFMKSPSKEDTKKPAPDSQPSQKSQKNGK